MSLFRKTRLWSKGRAGGYHVNEAQDSPKTSPVVRARKRSHDSGTRSSISSSSSSVFVEESEPEMSHTTEPTEEPLAAHKNGWRGSLDSLEDGEVWDFMSTQPGGAELLSTRRKKSVSALHLMDVELHEQEPEQTEEGKEDNDMKPKEIDSDVDIDVKEIAALFSAERMNGAEESDSDSTTTVSDSSEIDFGVSSDSEPEEEQEKEAFDFDAHLSRLLEREEQGSDTDSDGNESNASEAALKKAVRKVMRKIKRERSDEIAESETTASATSSEKGSDDEESDNSKDDSSSIGSDSEGGFEMAKDVDPEIAELMEGGLVIDPKHGKGHKSSSHIVYRYYLTKGGRIDSVPETLQREPDEEEEDSSTKETTEDNHLASTLDTDKVQDLRWPFSNYYVKEVQTDTVGAEGEEETLPSYRSTDATASFPGRKRNVMLGRVWWVEWWAREDTRIKTQQDLDTEL